MLFDLISLFVLAGILIWSARWTVDVFESLVSRLRVGGLAVAVILVALSSSLPELFVAITASIDKAGMIALGNVLGSNVANIGLVVGLASIFGGSIAIVGRFLKYEFLAALSAGMAPFVLSLDGSLSRLDGVLLLVMYAVYIRSVMKLEGGDIFSRARVVHKGIVSRLSFWHKNKVDKIVGRLLIGLGVLMASAEGVVRVSLSLAERIDVSLLVVGLLIVAVGTSLPELVLSIVAVRDKKIMLMLGSILGSIVANSSLILGVAVLISPIKVVFSFEYWIGVIAFVVLFVGFWLFSFSKRRLDRWEGGVLLGLYVVFVWLEMFMS